MLASACECVRKWGVFCFTIWFVVIRNMHLCFLECSFSCCHGKVVESQIGSCSRFFHREVKVPSSTERHQEWHSKVSAICHRYSVKLGQVQGSEENEWMNEWMMQSPCSFPRYTMLKNTVIWETFHKASVITDFDSFCFSTSLPEKCLWILFYFTLRGK